MNKILVFSLTASIIGILTISIISINSQPPQKNILEITQKDIYKKTKIQGIITGTKSYDNFQILTIQDNTGKIQVLVNSKTSEKNFSELKNVNVTVIGKITEYKNNLQIQAEEIQKVNKNN